MKHPLTSLFALLLFALSVGSCQKKEICYECTRESASGKHTITNCTDNYQIKIWKDEAEKRDYTCKKID